MRAVNQPMIRVLGLHFGHDASASVIANGKVESYVLRERHCRTKHAMTLDRRTIEKALHAAKVSADEIHYCAITSTQNIELLIDDPAFLRIEYREHQGHRFPCAVVDLLDSENQRIEERLNHSLLDILYEPHFEDTTHRQLWGAFFPEHRGRTRESFHTVGCIDSFSTCTAWGNGTRLSGLRKFHPFLSSKKLSESTQFGFHYPLTVEIGGTLKPGYFIHHHLAHAACSYYMSGFQQAAILSHDGYGNGSSYHSGMLYYAANNRIIPICPHHLTLGRLYERVGMHLGLGVIGPAGKLMGLSAYGTPAFFDPQFVGNQYDHQENHRGPFFERWIEHCEQRALELGYDMAPYRDPRRITAPVNTDIAASTQKLFEVTRLQTVNELYAILDRAGITNNNLCLTGGTALNCPSNSNICAESPFDNVYVEPCCDDSGLSIGAATALYYSVMGNPLEPSQSPSGHQTPFLGVPVQHASIQETLDGNTGITWTISADSCMEAARRLQNNEVIGWFSGASEAGPRALGARSILANPTIAGNWQRVNRIKGREAWRPFAPAILASELQHWYSGSPENSPYMLFTAICRSDKLPATTHVNGSARIQTVDKANGRFYELLTCFYKLSSVPVLLNTSFNGPGEPIVETAHDAIAFFLQSQLDCLIIEDFIVTR